MPTGPVASKVDPRPGEAKVALKRLNRIGALIVIQCHGEIEVHILETARVCTECP